MAADSDFTEVGITTDPVVLRDEGVTSLENDIPGLVLRPGHPIWHLLEAASEIAADLGLQIVDVGRYRFRTFGNEIVGVVPVEASYATAETTWTLADPDPDGLASRTITGGTQFSIEDRMFVTVGDETGAPGDELTVTGTAVVAGSDATGLTGTPVLREPYSFVESITLIGVTTGGVDAEADDDYEDRLARTMQHLGRPVLEADFAEKARQVTGVDRALAIDGYDANAGTSNNERTVTVAVADEDGANLSSGIKAEVLALLEGEREVNWDVFVIDPTRTTIDVSATVTVWDGYTASEVEAAAETAISDWLDPAAWGSPPAGSPESDWHDEPNVLRGELYAVINNVAGVRHVTALTLGWVRSVTGVAATDVVTSTAHGFSDTDEITLSGLTGGAPLVAATTYFVRDSTANTFKLALTSGGAAIDITTDLSAGSAHRLTTSDIALATPAPLPAVGTIAVTAA